MAIPVPVAALAANERACIGCGLIEPRPKSRAIADDQFRCKSCAHKHWRSSVSVTCQHPRVAPGLGSCPLRAAKIVALMRTDAGSKRLWKLLRGEYE